MSDVDQEPAMDLRRRTSGASRRERIQALFPAPAAGRFRILNYLDGRKREEMGREILQGMTRAQKAIPSKYFYDATGSRLFEKICRMPEYYPTNTELAILDKSAGAIMEFFAREGGDLIELGSGSNRKTCRLLDALPPCDRGRIRYVPVDISIDSLFDSARELLFQYPDLEILGIAGDFTRHLDQLPRRRKLITFLGSTIGNLTEAESVCLLGSLRRIMGAEDLFLLGMDMIKPFEILEAAYNDPRGITREFNRNILNHVNRELGGDFDPNDFDHVAFFNREKKQVEMHLRARRKVDARIVDLGMSVHLCKGETIHTEICRKFSRESACRMFRRSGFTPARWFTDPREWFSLVELRAEGEGTPEAGHIREV